MTVCDCPVDTTPREGLGDLLQRPPWPLQLQDHHEEPVPGLADPQFQALFWPTGYLGARGGQGEVRGFWRPLFAGSLCFGFPVCFLLSFLPGDALPGLPPSPSGTL